MKTVIRIDTAGAAFDGDNEGAEVARILRNLAERLEGSGVLARNDTKFLHDLNGNSVGTYKSSKK